MKRAWIILILVCCLFSTPFLSARTVAPVVMEEQTELPWSTVSAVLHEVEYETEIAYEALVSWYQVGRVTIDVVTGGYLVKIIDEDAHVESILIDNL